LRLSQREFFWGLFSTFANQALVVVNPHESGSSILISSFLREELA